MYRHLSILHFAYVSITTYSSQTTSIIVYYCIFFISPIKLHIDIIILDTVLVQKSHILRKLTKVKIKLVRVYYFENTNEHHVIVLYR